MLRGARKKSSFFVVDAFWWIFAAKRRNIFWWYFDGYSPRSGENFLVPVLKSNKKTLRPVGFASNSFTPLPLPAHGWLGARGDRSTGIPARLEHSAPQGYQLYSMRKYLPMRKYHPSISWRSAQIESAAGENFEVLESVFWWFLRQTTSGSQS